jgi:deltex-like protein
VCGGVSEFTLCETVYEVLIGDMPNGTMTDKVHSFNCSGYSNCNTIEIVYNFPDGVRNGVKYKGTIRKAYLPNNEEGKEILNLLREAFN